MPKSELVIFGRSPFIDQVDVPNLLEHYTTVGFNQFGRHYQVDHLFFFDDYFAGFKPTTLHLPSWFRQDDGIKYAIRPSKVPFFEKILRDGHPCLGHRYFTVSLALNWAIWEGFKSIYLVGIDHVETDTQFRHHDGDDLLSALTPESHQALKQYVYACTRFADIYQTNPAVREGWQLPFKHVSELYDLSPMGKKI